MRKSLLTICFIVLCELAFSQKTPDSTGRHLQIAVEKSGEDPYFFSERYPRFLATFKEQVIYNDSANVESYRFVYMPTFDHPVIVRIQKRDGVYRVYWKLLDGQSGYDYGKLFIDKNREITQQDWDLFVSKLNSANFWKIPSTPPFDEPVSTDESLWILEGKSNRKYHAIEMLFSAKKTCNECCKFLLSLTGINFGDID